MNKLLNILENTPHHNITHSLLSDYILSLDNSILDGHLTHTEYQPIKDTVELKTVGYEALARFRKSCGSHTNTQSVFDALIGEPVQLLALELMLKVQQSHSRPEGFPLYLNIHPVNFSSNLLSLFWKPFFERHTNIVVEITESYTNHHMGKSHSLMHSLIDNGIKFALDDMFAENAIFSPLSFHLSPIIKLDKSVLKTLRTHSDFKTFLRSISFLSTKSNKMLILEGIETPCDLKLALECKIPYVQGFLFKNDFVTI